MKKFIFVGILFMFVPFISSAQTPSPATTSAATAVASVNPGFLPGDFFYFLDRWGEALNLFLTFNQEARARLNLEYARERAAEIKQVLADPRRKVEDVADAKQNFNEHIANAAAVIKEEKSKGADVANLAKELDDELDASHEDIKDALTVHEDRASTAEEQLRAKIASLSPGDPQIEGLTKALEAITKEKDDAQGEAADLENSTLEQQATFEDAMGPEISAKKHLEQVLRLREWMSEHDGKLPASFATTTDQLLKQAEEAFRQGNFEQAKNLSEAAKHSVEKLREQSDKEGELENKDIQENDKEVKDSNQSGDGREQEGTLPAGTPNYRD